MNQNTPANIIIGDNPSFTESDRVHIEPDALPGYRNFTIPPQSRPDYDIGAKAYLNSLDCFMPVLIIGAGSLGDAAKRIIEGLGLMTVTVDPDHWEERNMANAIGAVPGRLKADFCATARQFKASHSYARFSFCLDGVLQGVITPLRSEEAFPSGRVRTYHDGHGFLAVVAATDNITSRMEAMDLACGTPLGFFDLRSGPNTVATNWMPACACLRTTPDFNVAMGAEDSPVIGPLHQLGFSFTDEEVDVPSCSSRGSMPLTFMAASAFGMRFLDTLNAFVQRKPWMASPGLTTHIWAGGAFHTVKQPLDSFFVPTNPDVSLQHDKWPLSAGFYASPRTSFVFSRYKKPIAKGTPFEGFYSPDFLPPAHAALCLRDEPSPELQKWWDDATSSFTKWFTCSSKYEFTSSGVKLAAIGRGRLGYGPGTYRLGSSETYRTRDGIIMPLGIGAEAGVLFEVKGSGSGRSALVSAADIASFSIFERTITDFSFNDWWGNTRIPLSGEKDMVLATDMLTGEEMDSIYYELVQKGPTNNRHATYDNGLMHDNAEAMFRALVKLSPNKAEYEEAAQSLIDLNLGDDEISRLKAGHARPIIRLTNP